MCRYLSVLSKASNLVVTTCLPLLPPTALPRRSSARPWRRAELGAGVLRVGGLDDAAVLAERFGGQGALAAERQRFRAVHLVEMRLVDLRAAADFVGGGEEGIVLFTPTPTGCAGRPSPQGGG